jgi:2-oxoglutarate dehydrogenase E2 component (dihydrolipoamide succinyltransferase)
MPTAVVMPQMGESVAEGTVVRWIKKAGDRVDRDEPLFEISTDKVDAEIPSPAAGILLDIRVREGETVPVDAVVATIGEPDEQQLPVAPADLGGVSVLTGTATATLDAPAHAVSSSLTTPATYAPTHLPNPAGKIRSSPLVRRIAREHAVDLSVLTGTGTGGRITKRDILAFLERPAGQRPSKPSTPEVPLYAPGEDVDVQPLSIVRRKIAERMVMSRRTSAHVHTVFNVDFTHVAGLRQRFKASYEERGAKLTYMAFIARVVADALAAHPLLNAAVDATSVVYKREVNIGIAVAFESGLIVPVIRKAGGLSVAELCTAIADLAERARSKRLKADDVARGTFTITNPGSFGAQFGLPIINQPQVAILGVGTVEKRPVVVDDAVVVRTMAYLTLGFDHRLVDGAAADAFMADVKHGLEQFDPARL